MGKSKKFLLQCAAVALLGAAGAVHAGKVTEMRVEPATIVAGGQAKVTVDGEDEGICGLRIEYGNGEVDVVRMNKDKDNFPRVFMHTYNTPGTYTVAAKGGRDGMILGCLGNASKTLTVSPPPAQPVRSAVPECPDGFVLNRSSVNKRTGAFSCLAKKGAQLPPAGIPCPPKTAYYTNTKGTLLGCKALPR